MLVFRILYMLTFLLLHSSPLNHITLLPVITYTALLSLLYFLSFVLLSFFSQVFNSYIVKVYNIWTLLYRLHTSLFVLFLLLYLYIFIAYQCSFCSCFLVEKVHLKTLFLCFLAETFTCEEFCIFFGSTFFL